MGHSQGHDLVGGHFRDIFSFKFNFTGLRRDQACNRMKDRGLSGSVGSDEGDNLTFVYLEGNVTQRMNQAVVNVDVLDFEHCHKLVSSSLIRPDKP